MSWRHGSIGICMVLVCAAGAHAERTADASCVRWSTNAHHAHHAHAQAPMEMQAHVRPQQRASTPRLDEPVRIVVGVAENGPRERAPWRTLMSSMFAAMPPSILDVTSSVVDLAFAIDDNPQFMGAFDITLVRKDGEVYADWSLHDEDARTTGSTRMVHLFGDESGWSLAATIAR